MNSPVGPGVIFGDRFEIEKLVGEGGVGRVFRAQDLQGGAPVAIKILRPEYRDDSRIRRRFMREARAANRLQHPNIVHSYAYGEHETGPFIVMEYIEGISLSDLRETGLGFEELMALTGEVLSALAYIHARGIVHRDLKPENVLLVDGVGDKRTSKLLDFGFARVEDEQDGLTKTDAFGTPTYMAPEQVSGTGGIGPGTDLYALGVILHEYISGKAPFVGTHGVAVALKHMTEDVPPLVARPGLALPNGIEAIIHRSMEKERAQRYRGAAEMRRAMSPFIERGEDPLEKALESEESLTAVESVLDDLFGDDVSLPDSTGPTLERGGIGLLQTGEFDFGAALFDVPIMGRTDERSWLWHHACTVSEGGAGRVLVVGAQAGMGRRRLVNWLKEQADERGVMRSMSIGARRGKGGSGTLREIFCDLFSVDPDAVLINQLDVRNIIDRWQSASEHDAGDIELGDIELGDVDQLRLLEYLRGETPGSGVGQGFAEAETGVALLLDCLRLASAEGPILLIVSNLEDSGEEAQRFVQAVAGALRSEPLPILLVVTYLQDSGAQGETVGELLAHGGEELEHRVLSPVTGDAIKDLVGAMAPLDDVVAEAIADRTGGNPLFARELVYFLSLTGELQERGAYLTLSSRAQPGKWPSSLEQTVGLRCGAALEAMDDNGFVKEVVGASAVLGRSFGYELLAGFLERVFEDGGRIERAIESLIEAHIFEEAGRFADDDIQFVHDVLHGVCLGQVVPGGGLRKLHHAAAEELMLRQASGQRVEPLRIARHFNSAGETETALGYFVTASRQSQQAGNLDEAAESLEIADAILAEIDDGLSARRRAEVWLQLGELDVLRGEHVRAQNLGARVHSWGVMQQDQKLSGLALLLLGDVLRAQESNPDAGKAYEHAEAVFRSAGEQSELARSLIGRGAVCRRLRRLKEAQVFYGEARSILEAVGDSGGIARVVREMGESALQGGDPDGASACFEEAAERYAQLGDRANALVCKVLLGECALARGDVEQARKLAEKGLSLFAAAGDSESMARVEGLLARADDHEGLDRSAAERFRVSGERWFDAGRRARAALAWYEAGIRFIRQASFVDARGAFGRALYDGRGLDDVATVIGHAGLAWASAEVGDGDQVTRSVSASLSDAIGILDPELALFLEGAGQCLARIGENNRARQCYSCAITIRESLGEEAAVREVAGWLAELPV